MTEGFSRSKDTSYSLFIRIREFRTGLHQRCLLIAAVLQFKAISLREQFGGFVRLWTWNWTWSWQSRNMAFNLEGALYENGIV